MSVDCSAHIIMGWFIENDKVYDYKEKCEAEGIDMSDFCWPINAYSCDTDYVYGINIARTSYFTFIEPDMMSIEAWEGDKDWERCKADFAYDFPNEYANVKPAFFLINHWW